jgi:hypothetical protein
LRVAESSSGYRRIHADLSVESERIENLDEEKGGKSRPSTSEEVHQNLDEKRDGKRPTFELGRGSSEPRRGEE